VKAARYFDSDFEQEKNSSQIVKVKFWPRKESMVGMRKKQFDLLGWEETNLLLLWPSGEGWVYMWVQRRSLESRYFRTK
jgi:hypothetical protein